MGEELFAKSQTNWPSGPKRATNAASLSERPEAQLDFELHHHRHMIAGLLPAAHLFQNLLRFERALQTGTGPDMVQPPAAVRSFPVGGAITPPGIDNLDRRDELAGDIGQV